MVNYSQLHGNISSESSMKYLQIAFVQIPAVTLRYRFACAITKVFSISGSCWLFIDSRRSSLLLCVQGVCRAACNEPRKARSYVKAVKAVFKLAPTVRRETEINRGSTNAAVLKVVEMSINELRQGRCESYATIFRLRLCVFTNNHERGIRDAILRRQNLPCVTKFLLMSLINARSFISTAENYRKL